MRRWSCELASAYHSSEPEEGNISKTKMNEKTMSVMWRNMLANWCMSRPMRGPGSSAIESRLSPNRRSRVAAAVALLEAAGAPALVPLLAAGLAKLTAPLAEDGFLQAQEVAVLGVVRVGKTPRELASNNTRLVDIRADDRHGDKGRLVLVLAVCEVFGVALAVAAAGCHGQAS